MGNKCMYNKYLNTSRKQLSYNILGWHPTGPWYLIFGGWKGKKKYYQTRNI